MPIIKSAIKRAKQSQVRHSRNLVVKSAVKKDIKAVITSLTDKDAKAVNAAWREAVYEIDRAVKKGTLHKNTAARRKARLNKLVAQTMGHAEKTKAVKKAALAKNYDDKKPAANI